MSFDLTTDNNEYSSLISETDSVQSSTVEERKNGKEPGNAARVEPLRGIKVLDISTYITGALASAILSDFGAEVIKVEHPAGDDLRRDPTPVFKYFNRNKKFITLDFHKEEARKIFYKLVADYDVVVENFRPGTLERWGIGYEKLKQINSALIMLRITGFGQNGPYSSKPCFGTLAEAMGGFAYLNGFPDRPPCLPPTGLADTLSALAGANSIVMALYNRDAGKGEGQFIDLALYEEVLLTTFPAILSFLSTGIVPNRRGNSSLNFSPRNAYQTSDGKWVVISAATESTAERIFNAINRTDLLRDSRFSSYKSRLKNSDKLDEIISSWMKVHDFNEVMKTFNEHDATIAPVYDAKQILDDPHFTVRGSLLSVKDKDFGQLIIPNVSPRMQKTPGRIVHTAKGLGEDNDEFYKKNLGFSDSDILRLKQEHII